MIFEPQSRKAPRRWAILFAAAAFTCALVITVGLMAATRLFDDEDNRRTILLWISLPLALSFLSWTAVQSGHALMRAVVWLSIIVVAFFIWIAAFSIGPYYIPVLVLLLLAGLAPWHAPRPAYEMAPEPANPKAESEKPGETMLEDALGRVGDK